MRAADCLRLLLLAAIWGASFLFMRIASPAFGAINTAFLRVFFGFVGLGIILLVMRTPIKFNGKTTTSMLLGVINSGLPFLMYSLAARWLPAGYSAILNATTPLMGALIGFSLFGEKLSFKKWAGVLLGLFGITLITTTDEINGFDNVLWGVLACLIATACYGFAGYLARRWISNKGGLDPKIVAFGSQMGATCFLLPFFGYTTTFGPAVNWLSGEVWICVLALGLLCTALAYILYFRLIADIGPMRSLTVTFLIPPFGILWSYLVLDEKVNQGFALGGVIVAAAVWLVVAPAKKSAVEHTDSLRH
ncbi:DMT family transporter [Rouxiella badensis]|uniref:DMT family transporter n=1 Tax=Rouxiella badensis TaxID=1646377 RepID=UPI0022AAAC46|nr:DMT family transporter [Rouxiella badensis]WAT09892.1 DMT family transporter [Rouxiella badensis]